MASSTRSAFSSPSVPGTDLNGGAGSGQCAPRGPPLRYSSALGHRRLDGTWPIRAPGPGQRVDGERRRLVRCESSGEPPARWSAIPTRVGADEAVTSIWHTGGLVACSRAMNAHVARRPANSTMTTAERDRGQPLGPPGPAARR